MATTDASGGVTGADSTYSTPVPGAFGGPGGQGYADLNLAANKAYKDTLARLNAQRMSTMRQYGYLGDVDPITGVIRHMRVDPNNPYGNLQSMFRTQSQGFQQADWGNEDRGLSGGLANQADSELKYEAGQQSAQLGTALQGTMGDYQDQQNQAAYSRDATLGNDELAAAEAAIGAGNFDPGTTDPTTGTTDTVNGWGANNNAHALLQKLLAQSPTTNTHTGKAISARASGASAAARALAIRSAAMNRKYKLGGR